MDFAVVLQETKRQRSRNMGSFAKKKHQITREGRVPAGVGSHRYPSSIPLKYQRPKALTAFGVLSSWSAKASTTACGADRD
jgi:hypothetical protein